MKLTLQGPPCGCPSRPTVILSVTSLGARPRSRHRQECSLIPHGDFVWFHADILYRAGMQAAYVVNTPWPFHGSCIVFHDCTIGAVRILWFEMGKTLGAAVVLGYDYDPYSVGHADVCISASHQSKKWKACFVHRTLRDLSSCRRTMVTFAFFSSHSLSRCAQFHPLVCRSGLIHFPLP